MINQQATKLGTSYGSIFALGGIQKFSNEFSTGRWFSWETTADSSISNFKLDAVLDVTKGGRNTEELLWWKLKDSKEENKERKLGTSKYQITKEIGFWSQNPMLAPHAGHKGLVPSNVQKIQDFGLPDPTSLVTSKTMFRAFKATIIVH